MKKIMWSILFIGLYAQAESTSNTESISETESAQEKMEKEKTGFFSFSLGGEVIPTNEFEHHTTVIGIKFGSQISQKSSFETGLKVTTTKVEQSFLTFQYGYSFINNSRWMPGLDAALLLGLKEEEDVYKLSGGFELGPYLKTFISKSHALILRGGITHDINISDTLSQLRIYLNLGVQWYL